MTARTVPARPSGDGTPRPLPWRRMAGVTWRQHRIALAGVAVLLGALTAGLWLVGISLHRAYAGAIACHPASSATCQNLANAFNAMDNFLSNGAIVQVVPVLIGAFIGAPVLARELETGTFRYAWTQGFGRWRWALAKLVALAVVVTAAAAAFSVLLSWYYQPYYAAGNQAAGLSTMTPYFPLVFNLHGIVFAAWTLAAFAIGALAGMLIRRVVPAIVATLTSYTALAFAAGGLLRQHYLTPLVTANNFNLPETAWIISQWSTRDGRIAFVGSPPNRLLNQLCSSLPPGPGKPSSGTFAQCLARHGYTQWTAYQPASRYWTFQWIESGWLLALSALLIAATIWLVRRRAT